MVLFVSSIGGLYVGFIPCVFLLFDWGWFGFPMSLGISPIFLFPFCFFSCARSGGVLLASLHSYLVFNQFVWEVLDPHTMLRVYAMVGVSPRSSQWEPPC